MLPIAPLVLMSTGLSVITFPKLVPVIQTSVPPYIEPIVGTIEVTFEPTVRIKPVVSTRPYSLCLMFI